MLIHSDLTKLVGHTPLLEAQRLASAKQVTSRLLLKLEVLNPGGSVKDRVALYMIEDAERKGLLAPGGTIIEATSGNTGIGLAWIAQIKGYRLILTMPETMSVERQQLLRLHGAEVVLTPGNEGMAGSVRRAEALCNEIPGAVILQQFNNKACIQAHEETTGPEILSDTEGRIDVFVAGVGTGGTLTGVARALKHFNPAIRIVAVEPQASPVLSGGKAGAHKIQGIGAGFVPQIYDASLVDEVIQIADEEAFEMTKQLIQHEGLFVGISSGAAVSATLQIASRPEFHDATIVTLLPDTGSRYLSLLSSFD
ncbi:MAG: cysteine synthase A [Bacteroidaceae bacterium]|nr:cysteine synthase A [Bacteroidaceae bacterium]